MRRDFRDEAGEGRRSYAGKNGREQSCERGCGMVRCSGGNRGQIEARGKLSRVEAQRTAQPDLVEQLVVPKIAPHRTLSRAPRRSARPRRS